MTLVRLTYVLLSPTWGMHQYTAGLANQMAALGHQVHLVTTRRAPLDRYAPACAVRTPIASRDTGFSFDALRPLSLHALLSTLSSSRSAAPSSHVIHLTGPHLWNPLVLDAARRAGIPTVHTLHDLHPHPGVVYGRLLYLWNRSVRRRADHLLVHGQCARDELLAGGLAPERLTCMPLTHLFVGYEQERALLASPPEVAYEPWALFFGRLEPYKGLDTLLHAATLLSDPGHLSSPPLRILVTGPGHLPLPVRSNGFSRPQVRSNGFSRASNVDLRPGFVPDAEAIDLFRRCGLVVLPYVEASQSALVAAAYFFHKPVVVTRVGALPELVVDGQTGWIVPPGDPAALAGALRRALSDPARLARMGSAARATYDRQRQLETAALHTMYTHLAALHPPLLRADP